MVDPALTAPLIVVSPTGLKREKPDTSSPGRILCSSVKKEQIILPKVAETVLTVKSGSPVDN